MGGWMIFSIHSDKDKQLQLRMKPNHSATETLTHGSGVTQPYM